MTTALERAHAHLDAIRRRNSVAEARTRMLLGEVLDILAAQQAEIMQLRVGLNRLADPCPRCAQREDLALDAKMPEPAPYASHLPWLGARSSEAADV